METSCKKIVFFAMFAILFCGQVGLFAQSSSPSLDWETYQRITHDQFTGQGTRRYGWVWMVGSIAVFSACTYLFYLWFQRTQVGKEPDSLDSPKALFRELATTHQLTWAQSRFLHNLAADLRLPDPCLIFVEPLCLAAAQKLPQYSRQQLELRTLEERFFGMTVTVATEMYSSVTSVLRNEYLPEMGAAMADISPTEYIPGGQATMVASRTVSYPSSSASSPYSSAPYLTNVAGGPTETMNSTMMWNPNTAADQTAMFPNNTATDQTVMFPNNKNTVQQAISLIAAKPSTSPNMSPNVVGVSEDQVTTVIPPLFRSGDPTKLRREHMADLGHEQGRMEKLFGQDKTKVNNVVPPQRPVRVEEPLNEKITQYLAMGMENTREKPAFLEPH